jgi:Ca-activated chloride channel family protein
MRITIPLAGAVLACVVLACGRHDRTRPHAPARPTITREEPPPPLAPALASVPVRGADERVAHPREDVSDAVLGARVTPRRLPLPRVGLGRSARFQFDGERRGWVLQLADGALLATPAYARGKVFVGAGFSSTTVYALDAKTGALEWTGVTPDGGPSAAIVEDDTVMFNTESCTLFAFDVETGRLKWSKWLGDPLMSQPAAAGGRVFTAWPDGARTSGFSFGALSSRNGTILWKREAPADVITAPVIAGDSVYFATMDGTLQRHRLNDGHRFWQRALNATSAPAVDGERVYIAQRVDGGRERQLVIDANTGRTLTSGAPVRAAYTRERPDTGGVEAGWSWEGSRPAQADGRLYHAMGEEIVARDLATGREVWRRRNNLGSAQRGVTSPAVVGSQLVVGTRGGDLYGMDIDTGATTWAYHVGEPIAFQPVVAGGWVYAATARGKVVGIEVGDAAFDGWHMWGGNAKHTGPLPAEANATGAPPDDRPTQGTLRVAGAEAERFPLVHTRVGVEVAGHVARFTVEQSFSNPRTQPADAEYLFPLPSDAAVDAMDLHVGERVIHGDIARREEARRTYATARAQGRTAALLEQERPNLFRQAVANIRPGEPVRVVLRFAETVPWHDGTYELVMPLATGSRYTPGAGGVTPTRPPGDVELRATVDLGVELADVSSPSHALATRRLDGAKTEVSLAQGAALPDRDFILRYKPRVDTVAPAFVARHDGREGFFALQLHPDVSAPDEAITPRELVFVVDTSSSMRGRPLDHARAVMRRAVERMRPTDTFRVMGFSDTVAALSPTALTATDENRARARTWIDGLQAAGSTEMVTGLRAALAGADDPMRVRMVVMLTDGYVGNEREVFAAVQSSLGTSRVFAVGVGSAVNRYLLEELAEVGRGSLDVVTLSEDPAAAAERFYAKIDRPYLTDVQVDFGALDVAGVHPRVIPDLFADRPLTLVGRYARAGDGDVTVRGRIRGRQWSRTLHVTLPASVSDAGASVNMARGALPSVWARARVRDLSRAMLLGETDALKGEVTDLGLRYGLVTPYTSFVAVDVAGPSAGVSHRVHDGSTRGSGPLGVAGIGSAASSFGGLSGTGYGMGAPAPARQGVFDMLVQAEGRAPAAPSPSAAPEPVTERAPSARVEVGSGDLDRDSLRAVFTRNAGSVRAVYERALRANPAAHGTIVLSLTIAPDGHVEDVTITRDDLHQPELIAGILAAIRRWQFPPHAGTESIRVAFPLHFEPGS